MGDAFLNWINVTDSEGPGFSNNTQESSNTSVTSDYGSGNKASTVEDWLIQVSVVTAPILFVLGLFGNTLTLVVTSRVYKNSTHGLYITAMAIADITFLITQPLNRTFVHDLFGRDIRAFSLIGCKVYFFFLRWARPMSSLVIVLICIERFIAIWVPLKAKIFSSRRSALIQIFSIFALASFVSGFRTQTVGIKNDVCLAVVLTPYNRHLKEWCSVLGMSVRTLIPTITLLALTPPTVAKLFYHRYQRRLMSNGNEKKEDGTFHVSIMLLSVAIAFCILVSPLCLAKHSYLFMGTNIVSTSSSWMRSLNEIRLICEQINCVINFILYVLLSSMFRQQFYAILTCKRPKLDRKRPWQSSSYRSSTKMLPSVSSTVSSG